MTTISSYQLWLICSCDLLCRNILCIQVYNKHILKLHAFYVRCMFVFLLLFDMFLSIFEEKCMMFFACASHSRIDFFYMYKKYTVKHDHITVYGM